MTTEILFPYRKKLNRRSLVASMTTLRRINQPMTKSPSYTNTCIPCDHPRSFILLIEAVAVTCQHGCCSRLKFCVTRPSASRPDCLRLACFVSAMLVTDAQPLACPSGGFLCCRERRLDSDRHTASVTMDGKRSSAWIAWSRYFTEVGELSIEREVRREQRLMGDARSTTQIGRAHV